MINYAKEKLPTRCDTQQLIFLMFWQQVIFFKNKIRTWKFVEQVLSHLDIMEIFSFISYTTSHKKTFLHKREKEVRIYKVPNINVTPFLWKPYYFVTSTDTNQNCFKNKWQYTDKIVNSSSAAFPLCNLEVHVSCNTRESS